MSSLSHLKVLHSLRHLQCCNRPKGLWMLWTGGRFVARAVLTDLDPSTVDHLRGTPYGRIFRPDNVICGELQHLRRLYR